MCARPPVHAAQLHACRGVVQCPKRMIIHLHAWEPAFGCAHAQPRIQNMRVGAGPFPLMHSTRHRLLAHLAYPSIWPLLSLHVHAYSISYLFTFPAAIPAEHPRIPAWYLSIQTFDGTCVHRLRYRPWSVLGLRLISPTSWFTVAWSTFMLLVDSIYVAFWVPISVGFCECPPRAAQRHALWKAHAVIANLKIARLQPPGKWDGQVGWASGMGKWDGRVGWASGMGEWDGQVGWASGMGK
eukprot:352895-Chlamydomonas_euryale.AAC.3